MPVHKVSSNFTGSHFLSYSLDGTVVLWETLTGKKLYTFFGDEKRKFPSVVFSPDGKQVVHAHSDGSIFSFHIKDPEEKNLFAGHKGPVNCLAFSPDGQQMISGGWDGTMRLWDFNSAQDLWVESFGSAVNGVVFLNSGEKVLVGLDSCSLLVWDTDTCTEHVSIKISEQDELFEVELSPSGRYGIYSVLGIIDLEKGKELDWSLDFGAMLGPRRGGTGPNLAFSKDDRLIATGHNQGVVKIWQTNPFRLIRTLENGGRWAHCVAFSPNNKFLMCATDLSFELVNVATGELCDHLAIQDTPAKWLNYLPCGNKILSAHGELLLDETKQRGLKVNGEYQFHDNVVRLWSIE